MTEFDAWLQAEARKEKAVPSKGKVNLKALTYSCMVVTAILCVWVISYGTTFSYIIGGGVLTSLIGLSLYYQFVIVAKSKNE